MVMAIFIVNDNANGSLNIDVIDHNYHNSVSATSAPIEHVFSVAGNILRPERSRLLPNNFEVLLFLKTLFIIVNINII